MAHRETLVRSGGIRRTLDTALLGGVSLLALMMTSDLGEARNIGQGTNTVAPTAAAQQATIAAAQQAAGAAAQAQASLARASAALAAARRVQQDAAAMARATPSSVPDGLRTGGLVPAAPSSDPFRWVGAADPRQTTNGSRVTVDIDQTQPKSILNWQTFNVGANTTVNFNQAASDWIALNRVTDPSASPSRILGQINALGSVYIINRNGIIFGGGSQINVQSLVASTLDVGKLTSDQLARNQYFLNTGIGNDFSFSLFDPVGGQNSTLIPGNVTVQAGASITANVATDVVPLGSPGFIYLFGANVSNFGTLTAPQGQVAMAASRAITLTPGKYDAATFPSNVLPSGVTFRGTGLQLQSYSKSYTNGNPNDNRYYRDDVRGIVTGEVTTGGVIDTREGIVTLAGDRVAVTGLQDVGGNAVRDAAGNLIAGVISADTSITRNSMVLMHAATNVKMDGVISILPYDDGNTLPILSGAASSGTASNVQGYMPAYVEMTAQRSVAIGASGLVSAPSASVSLTTVRYGVTGNPLQLFNANDPAGGNTINTTLDGPQQVLLSGTIDVAGLQDVVLPASYNFISFDPRAEFADMPLLRSGPLYGQKLWIDIRASGTRSDGTTWVGTPVADASGVVRAVGRSINQLMTAGGTVNLTTDLGTPGIGVPAPDRQVIATAGSVINVAGGKVTFLPGMVPSTRLLGIDGRMYSMTNANPDMVYVGIAGQFTRDHSRWGVKETWSTGTQTYAPGYSEGHDAGAVTISTISPQLNLGGAMYFGSVAGERQTTLGSAPSDKTDPTRPLQAKGDELASQGYLAINAPSYVQIGATPSLNFNAKDPVMQLSADTLSGYGLSALKITAYDLVVSTGSTLRLAPGGQFTASVGGAIDIAGTISAPGGIINLSTGRYSFNKVIGGNVRLLQPPIDPATGAVIAANVFVGGSLDVSGKFVNDTGRSGADVQGPAYINGGVISIATNKGGPDAGPPYPDLTGNILLARGSVLDASSGGYISPLGKAKTVSTGVMAGKGGSIVLALYQGADWDTTRTNQPPPPTPDSGQLAVIRLDGTMLAYGFESNGSLTLGAADAVRIGGALQPGEKSTIRVGQGSIVPTTLLTSGGFGSYTIETIVDGYSGASASITVSAGENLKLQQSNLSSTSDYTTTPTGTRLGAAAQQAPATNLALLPDEQRKPVDLTLKAATIVLDSGSSIVTDPKATITLGGSPVASLDRKDPLRDKQAQSVLLRGSIVDHGGTVAINALNTWFDSWTSQQRARVDLSGMFIANSRFGQQGGPIIGGTVIKGGTLSIEAGELGLVGNQLNILDYAYTAPGSGSLVAESGLQVDVSGYAGVVQISAGRAGATSTWLWSDAGSVSMDVFGLAWGGSFAATGGRLSDGTAMLAADGKTAVANNGTIILGGGQVFLQQDNKAITAALASFHQSNNKVGPTSILVSADQLAPFDNVYLYSGGAPKGAARIFTDLPGNTNSVGAMSLRPLTIATSLNWHVANRLHIAASSIAAGQAGSSVSLDAPYVELTGGGAAVQSGTSTLTVTAQNIDIEGAALSGFGKVQLKSAGDLRLSTPKVANVFDLSLNLVSGPSSFVGTLATYGDLLLSAQRIYPVSAVDFTINSTAGNVTFRAPGGSNTAIPLSADGSLTVTASNIDQGGNLFAPLGKITLAGGTGTNPDGTRQGVVLQPGSLTSVTLADTIVPYGATLDGTGWYYNAGKTPLSAPPAKGLEFSGANVAVKAGSTIDLRGGGDLQAMEWIQGKGGSRDTLASVNNGLGTGSGAGPTVYALLPARNDAVAAFDIHFTAAGNANALGKFGTPFKLPSGQVLYLQAGDDYPRVGSQITIGGGAGIPAGAYTLYPAHYATLPGALRVTYYGDNLGRNLPSGTTLPDGTVLVTGNYTQSTQPAKQSSGQGLFALQTGAVWQQYSEYTFSTANTYFTQKAVRDGANVPRLPMDGGRLAVTGQQQMSLAGTALSQPAPGGRGGELDISATKLAVVSSAAAGNGPAGYVAVDVGQLNNFGFESILIGGKRSDVDPAKGTLITPTASEVLVDTRGEKLTAPEVLLVTQAAGQMEKQDLQFKVGSTVVNLSLNFFKPSANDGSITIKSGSIIETAGTMHAGFGRNYYFAEVTPKPTPLARAQEVAQSLGGTLQADGTITGVDLSKLSASTAVNYYGFGGPTTKQPGLGSLFAASNDPNLGLSGPTGTRVPPLTLKFADLKSGAMAGVPAGPVTAPDGSPAQLVLPGGDAGRVTIEAGATVSTDTLTMQATASTKAIVIDGGLHARQVNLNAHTFAIGQGSASAAGNSVQLSGSQFSDVQGLTLRSLSGAISVYGTFDPGSVMTNLSLDAAAVLRAGSGDGKVNVLNGAITLVNSRGLDLPASLPPGSGNLGFEATEIVLGGGTQTIAGASRVTMRATDRVLVAGPGKLTLGTGTDQVNLDVATPTVLVTGATAAGSGSFSLITQGDVTLADIVSRTQMAQRPDDSPEIGGNLAVVARTIAVGNTIQAQAGILTLEATGADIVNGNGSVTPALRLMDGAYIAAGGYAKTLVDTTTYVAGGKVLLQADPGNAGGVLTAATSVIDVAQPADGIGYGGRIEVAATAGRAVLLGDLRGRGGDGLGGSFKLDANRLDVDDARLDTLADKLLAGGLSRAIDIHTRTGNLTLSAGHTLKANAVTLTADDTTWDSANAARQFGQITIAGKIDASGYAGTTADGTGQAGGQVGLYGANQVTLAGTSVIDASTAHADERGGDVTVGIPWAAHGKIRLQSGMYIDVSGGTKGGLSGGTVTFRAPVDGNGDARIAAIDAAGQELPTFKGSNIQIKGARAVTVEGFVAFDTKASPYGLDGSKYGWDGLIDPAGVYDANGNLAPVTWAGITGYQINVGNAGRGYKTPPIVQFNNSASNQNIVIAVMGLDAATLPTLSPTNGTLAPNQTGIKVTFDTPTNTGANVENRAALATASTDATGKITITMINDAGSGYVNLAFGARFKRADGTDINAADGSRLVASIGANTGGLKVVGFAAAVSANPLVVSTVQFIGGSGIIGATATAVRMTSFTGTTNASGIFQLDNKAAFASAVPDPLNPPSGSTATRVDTAKHQAFFGGTLVQFSQGSWTDNNQNYGFQNLIGRLSPLAQDLGEGVVHVRPGIELVNSDPNRNSGNITVKSAWNLAAGRAYNLQTNQQPNNTTNGTKYVHVYENSAQNQQSYVTFDYRLAADYGTGSGPAIEPGALTLRAVNNVVVGASISDGFFQFRDYLNKTYAEGQLAYLVSHGIGQIDILPGNLDRRLQYYLYNYVRSPIAPYKSSANLISPSAPDLAAADLFPNQLNVCIASCGTANSVGVIPQGARIVTVTDPGSWTYRVTAGADLRSGNPNAVKPLASTIYNPGYIQVYDPKNPSQMPSVILTGQTSYAQVIYTGALSFSQVAASSTAGTLSTMVRTGTGSINVGAAYNVFLTDPDPASTTANAAAPGVIYAAGVNTPRAGNGASGLVDPKYQLVNGRVVATALNDPNVDPDQLFFEPQLLALGVAFGPPTAAAFPHMGGDVQITAQQDIVGYILAPSTATKTSYQYFKPWLLAVSELSPAADVTTGAAINVRGQGMFAPNGARIASQTAWWLQYGSFQQGILSAGGNVTATAGRDAIDLSVSLPTTGRVSGGISLTSTPVTHVYDSGNMAVSAGRDILGGAFYEGSGHASIVAGRSVGATSQKLAWKGIDRNLGTTTLIDNLPLLAVDLGRIQLTAGGSLSIAGVVNPAAMHAQKGSFGNPNNDNGLTNTSNVPLYMDTYGPDSGVGLLSVTGNVAIAFAPTSAGTNTPPPPSPLYPASFEAVALGGDIKALGWLTGLSGTRTGITLSGSEHGDFQLLAEGSIDLKSAASISAGPALLDKAFDPFRPNAWYGTHSDDASYAGPFTSAVLAHQNDDAIARIVAATGNIVGFGTTSFDFTRNTVTSVNRIEINRPTVVYAGGNITDLNLIVQNIRPSDVSSVTAGGNITYTGSAFAGGLQVAGPGFFVVQAGGDLGPFLPLAFDTSTNVKAQQGIASVGNSSSLPVGNPNPKNTTAAQSLTGIYNVPLLGSPGKARRNALLGSSGADVIALFGVAKGINYKAVLDAYVDPANSAIVPHNYLSELLAFLARVKIPAGPDPLATFASLPQSLQHVFIDQVFFAELKAVGLSADGKQATPRGYQMIETMFPPSYGYTANDGVKVRTGDFDLRHATLQTKLGGDISVFGPGGSILVGPLAPEPNPNLKLRDLGILTLGGGAINTFTDQSVLVNSSRVLTTQGGDVLMWSSNGDLDAGRGSKTTLSMPPLQVLFDANDYQSIDLGGFVTGAGIGTLKSSRVARAADLYLLAPRGIVDFGVAGGRSSGNLVVVAPVVANASNIQVAGTVTGVSNITVPDIGGLTAASNTAGAAAKSAEAPTGGGNQSRASIFIVEVVGYGGGDGADTNAVPNGGGNGSGPAPAQPGATPSNHDGDDKKNGAAQP